MPHDAQHQRHRSTNDNNSTSKNRSNNNNNNNNNNNTTTWATTTTTTTTTTRYDDTTGEVRVADDKWRCEFSGECERWGKDNMNFPADDNVVKMSAFLGRATKRCRCLRPHLVGLCGIGFQPVVRVDLPTGRRRPTNE
jgi:hypothetical protein